MLSLVLVAVVVIVSLDVDSLTTLCGVHPTAAAAFLFSSSFCKEEEAYVHALHVSCIERDLFLQLGACESMLVFVSVRECLSVCLSVCE